jgi:hypothetical protein
MAKVELSDRLRFSAGRLFADRETETLDVRGHKTAIKRGDRLRGRIDISGGSDGISIHSLRVEVAGQREEGSSRRDLRLRTELFQSSMVPANYVMSIPVLFQSHEDAVFSQHGADWLIRVKLIAEQGDTESASLSFRIIP